ncbi:MAG: HAMP domain-containing histidine kinase [Gammaproteobacteria bacterium]|nr:HAMP domain-containing histidine kinase [Gammaproteobacteria bacterium]
MNTTLDRFLDWLKKHADTIGAQYFAFGVFGFIIFPSSYFFWHNILTHEYNPFFLRIVAALLCIPLIFHKQWPKKMKRFLPFHWYITILYCLPFFGTFMLLMNHFSNIWIMNMMLGSFLFVLLVDWLMFIFLLLIGAGSAWIVFLSRGGQIHILSKSELTVVFYMYFFTVAIGIIFSRRKEKLADERVQSMKLIATSIAHELRTPLRAIDAGASGLQKYLPSLLAGYDAAKQHDLDIPKLPQNTLQNLNAVLSNINSEVQASFTVINMLLVNANEADIGKNYQLCSANACVDTALARYPFMPDERSLVAWRPSADFLFRGNEQLMIHILFNLFKNGLYFLKAADKGSITIWSEHTADWHYLQFKDTGQGINKSDLPHIFDRFFSRTRHGTGIGLAFCKIAMKSFGGDILCESTEGEYTLFTMKFPRIE